MKAHGRVEDNTVWIQPLGGRSQEGQNYRVPLDWLIEPTDEEVKHGNYK